MTSRGARGRLWAAPYLALVLVVTGVVVFALRAEGYQTHRAELNDGGIWVTNSTLGYYGRLNKPIGQLDGALFARTDATLDIVQDGAAVVGVDAAEARPLRVEALLGCGTDALLAFTHDRVPRALLLPNGLTVWLQAEFRPLGDASDDAADGVDAPAQAGASGPAAASVDDPATLAALSLQLIEQTLAACGGNVSQAARRLGVSRGLLYRRLKRR